MGSKINRIQFLQGIYVQKHRIFNGKDKIGGLTSNPDNA